MTNAIQIIAACTDRKRAEPRREHRLGSWPHGPARPKAWIEALAAAEEPLFAARDLYLGNHWSIVRQLPEVGGTRGWSSVALWVASAGYGLVDADARLAPYSATFAPSASDSVVDPKSEDSARDQARHWWHALSAARRASKNPRSVADLAHRDPGTAIIVIGSRHYVQAMADDLVAARGALRKPERLVLVTTGSAGRGELEPNVVSASARMLDQLSGPLTSLHARLARHLLENLSPSNWSAAAARGLAEKLEASSTERDAPARTPMSDDEVKRYVREQRAKDPNATATGLLRALRGSGRACEQKRFRNLVPRDGGETMTSANGPSTFRRRALRLVQDEAHPLYLFAMRADELFDVADISRVSRDDAGDLIGYQRPEVKRHVENIVEYLNSGANVLFPHALILALDSSTTFKAVRGPRVDEGLAEAGTLTIRAPRKAVTKPAWIVDGQQRALALARCKRGGLAVPIAAFVADDLETQREQFLLVNTARPLPRGLVSELLPEVDSLLPPNLAVKRAPAALVELMNRTPESPFFNLIRRASSEKAARKSQVVTDTALIQALSESLTHSAGCFFSYRNVVTGETDYDGVLRVLLVYWTAVRQTFPEAWGKPPAESRLMHSVGIKAMSKLMDRMMASVDASSATAIDEVKVELARIQPICRWTSGMWEDLGIPWNKLEMTQTHLRYLSNVLIRAYLSARR